MEQDHSLRGLRLGTRSSRGGHRKPFVESERSYDKTGGSPRVSIRGERPRRFSRRILEVLVVYPVSTTSAKSYCQRKVPSGNKTDHAEIQQQFTTNLYGVVHVMQAALRSNANLAPSLRERVPIFLS